MAILLVLVPISLILFGLAVWAFVWAVRGGQYDDLDTPAIDILCNDSTDANSLPADSLPQYRNAD